MKLRQIRAILLLLFFISCNQKKIDNNDSKLSENDKYENKISTQNISVNELPKELTFKGNFIKATKLKDEIGNQIVLLTQTEETQSEKIKFIEHEFDKSIYVYNFLLNNTSNKYELNWKIQDFEKNCDFDLIIGFLDNTNLFTDLNNNGITEIWSMYQKGCVSDVSSLEMKIIMYEGENKHTIRGNSLIDFGNSKFGGEYKIDDNFLKSHPKILNFAKRMWKDNYIQKFE
ncbi:M949_RS01915 family surface polysaccharide biosynthesis protein [Flavobacterium okayamense]|uniref:Lipoprotein n=1 Tax=Flavobacterium okayamense TaxID=2830782 RepID=A0ABM7S5K3_9FLAO|nr:hypothetical protein [Flavobacterium okayamense]BCY28777.1 hypothetical protein KK2020170_16450 [Flavobacterium okayamense]